MKSGIESLITSTEPNADIKKQLPKVPLPSEPRPLYEIYQEVPVAKASGDIYAPSYGYAIPSQTEGKEAEVNIQKNVESVKKEDEKEDKEKKKEKKDK